MRHQRRLADCRQHLSGYERVAGKRHERSSDSNRSRCDKSNLRSVSSDLADLPSQVGHEAVIDSGLACQ